MLQCRRYSRYESRLLEFWCLIVIVAINIGTFTCGIMEVVCFGAAVLLFVIFNVLRVSENRIMRSLWMLPLILCYLPFYIFNRLLPVG